MAKLAGLLFNQRAGWSVRLSSFAQSGRATDQSSEVATLANLLPLHNLASTFSAPPSFLPFSLCNIGPTPARAMSGPKKVKGTDLRLARRGRNASEKFHLRSVK